MVLEINQVYICQQIPIVEIQHIILEVTITWVIIKDGAIASLSIDYKNAMVPPVISLKADVIVADTATANDPYDVS